jgi:hypothetical protein
MAGALIMKEEEEVRKCIFNNLLPSDIGTYG